ncbi:MAG: hypothetical protein HFI41_05740 [Lachnospiraceae bacterium]|nr:hypothetical protein [Lachnospiraceae bacterium]
MDIKKVDDKPMVIHSKKKFGLHVKSAPKAETRDRAGKERETGEAAKKEGQVSAKQAKILF